MCESNKCKESNQPKSLVKEEIKQEYPNSVKIDNFIILEKESCSDYDSKASENSEIISFRKINMENLSENEKKKINEAILSVFSEKNLRKLCIICDHYVQQDYSNEILKFKTLEDFLFFSKYFFQPNENYFNLSNENSKRNIHSFEEQYQLHQKYYKNDYTFKSVKYICKLCFQKTLNQENGFYVLFNSLHISNNILNSSKYSQKKTNSPEMSKQNLHHIKTLIEDLNPKNEKNMNVSIDKQYNIVIRKDILKCENGNPNVYNNLLDITNRFTLNQKNNIPVPTLLEMNLQKNNNSINNENLLLNLMKNPNLNKQINSSILMPLAHNLASNFQNISHDALNNLPNVQSQSKLNELGKMIDLAMQYESAAQNKNNQVLSSLANASNILVEEIERKSDDILSNFPFNLDDPQKKKDFLDRFYNYFEEIKKQIFSMQQNNNAQSNLISLIFKNLETFFGQVSGTFNPKNNPPFNQDPLTMLPNKLNDINIPPNLLSSLPNNSLNGLGNNKLMMNDSQFPQLSLNQINNSLFPFGLDQFSMSNNIGMSNSNQIFQNNLNLFPPINPSFPTHGLGMPQNIPNNLLIAPLMNNNLIRHSGQVPVNPLTQINPFSALFSNMNPNNSKI
jgi:hypothetical protein